MVGRRALHAFGNGKSSGHSQKQINGSNPYKPKPAAFRFQDAANAAVEDERRNKIKNSLIDAVKGDELESFRKSDDEVRASILIPLAFFTVMIEILNYPQQLKSIDNKKVRHFYEEQNEALSDWLEVDSVVRSIADDILESFDPDRDHDGLLEHGGALQAQNEDVEAFLPQEEREKRSKGERDAKRAINVRQTILPPIDFPLDAREETKPIT